MKIVALMTATTLLMIGGTAGFYAGNGSAEAVNGVKAQLQAVTAERDEAIRLLDELQTAVLRDTIKPPTTPTPP